MPRRRYATAVPSPRMLPCDPRTAPRQNADHLAVHIRAPRVGEGDAALAQVHRKPDLVQRRRHGVVGERILLALHHAREMFTLERPELDRTHRGYARGCALKYALRTWSAETCVYT